MKNHWAQWNSLKLHSTGVYWCWKNPNGEHLQEFNFIQNPFLYCDVFIWKCCSFTQIGLGLSREISHDGLGGVGNYFPTKASRIFQTTFTMIGASLFLSVSAFMEKDNVQLHIFFFMHTHKKKIVKKKKKLSFWISLTSQWNFEECQLQTILIFLAVVLLFHQKS